MEIERFINNVTATDFVDWLRKHMRREKNRLITEARSMFRSKYVLIDDFEITPPSNGSKDWLFSISLNIEDGDENRYLIVLKVSETDCGVIFVMDFPEGVEDFAANLLLDISEKYRDIQSTEVELDEKQSENGEQKINGVQRIYSNEKSLTIGEIRRFLELEEAADNGDLDAQKKLSEIENPEKYREAIDKLNQTMKEIAEKAKVSLSDVFNPEWDDELQKSLNALVSTPGGENLKNTIMNLGSGFQIPPASIQIYPSPQERLADEIAESNKLQREILNELREQKKADAKRYQLDEENQIVKAHGGRPGLNHEELIYRLAKAQEAEEIRKDNPRMTWKEIAKTIGWRHGYNKAGVKLLEDARQRIQRMENGQYGVPEVIKNEIRERRKKKET